MKPAVSLLFSQSDLQLARDNQEREPIRSALPRLESQPEDALARAQLQALRCLLYKDSDAGRTALEAIETQDFQDFDPSNLAAIKRRFGWLTVLSQLREQPDFADSHRAAAGAAAQEINGADGDLPRTLWLAAVAMAGGILLEDDARVQSATAVYRRVVDRHIHPEGFFKGIVDVDGARQTYQAQFAATGALALMSEMAQHAGQELWSYNNRAVSANTAATYSFYYYFFPERWRWEEGLAREHTVATMRREGAFFEMVNRRSPLRGAEELFAEQRPMFSPVAGGLTTLTHGLKPRAKKRWRLF